MNARHLAGFLHQVLDPRPRQSTSFRVEGPNVAGRAFRGPSVQELTVVAHSSTSSRAAERLRLALIDGAARLQSDAGPLTSPVELLATPDAVADQPATFLAWTTWSAKLEQRWVAAYLRRGRVTWEVLAMGETRAALGPVVEQVAADLTAREPAPLDGSLWDLLPTPSDLPVLMRLTAILGEDAVQRLADVA